MDEEIKDQESQTAPECGCEGGNCSTHQTESDNVMQTLTKHRGSEEMALAFLLALTPLVILTFFGQVGLL